MTYEHSVTIYRLGDAPEPGQPGAPDVDSGWAADDDGAPASSSTLYRGPADVQDGQRTLRRLAEMGESEQANAVVYLPPSASSSFALVQTGDLVTTPLGSGEVVGLMQTDGALAVALTRSEPSAPVLIN